MTPIAGLIVSIFLQPGGNADLGYTAAWAAENALNVAVSIVVTFLMPNSGQSTVTMTTNPGTISLTNYWTFPEGASNFQLAAITQ